MRKGRRASWAKGSGDELTLTFKRFPDGKQTYGLFTGIEVDGAAASKANSSGAANYTAESGSLVLKLQPTFLESLSVGDHELKALFEDGDAAATVFAAVVLAALALAVALAAMRKRRS